VFVSKKYADVALPTPIRKLFTYKIPETISALQVGTRVLVPFGKSKMISGIVFSIHENKPEFFETKPIEAVLDDFPIVLQNQLDLWNWISEYYQCSLGEVYRAALPAGLRLESESRFYFNECFEEEINLSKNAIKVLDYLEKKKSGSLSDLNKITGLKNVHAIVNQLIEVKALFVEEKVAEKYKTKKEKVIFLSEALCSESALNKAFDNINRAPAQLRLLMNFINKTGSLNNALNGKSILKKDLLSDTETSGNILNELIKKKILTEGFREIDRLDFSEKQLSELRKLSIEQTEAYNEIKNGFEENKPVLLHGVTSSGKTEIYIHLIEETINKGAQALYLLPEIALTTQITNRLKSRFGNKLGIYHSKFSDAERVEVWNNLLKNKNFQVIVGVRSAVFLPFSNLGLIIVDEEHEHSFKQYDPAPRYHARDVALMLGRQFNANVLLGTATPSIESYYNAISNKFQLVELNTRYEGICMPEIIVADVKDAKRRKIIVSHFTPELVDLMTKALENKEQIILFQNRRGFSPYLECKECAWVPKCEHCDVSLTYHKNNSQLMCHYCGFSTSAYHVCKACETPALVEVGFGTQKIEEDIKKLFPDKQVARMDYDTTRSKNSYDRIISDFEYGKVDILIGTQMVSKGLDFDRVSLVGILDADSLLNYPDFRAFEKSFQMLAQVSGRAGRKNKRGKVVLQTSNPTHPVISYVSSNNYKDFFYRQLEERKLYKYPPFYRLTFLTLKHKNQTVVNQVSKILADSLYSAFGVRITGPVEPVVKRINDYFLQRIIIKLEREASQQKAKTVIRDCIDKVLTDERWRSVTVAIDVDPY
jgi:primosomal protein N' (replication factor Y)